MNEDTKVVETTSTETTTAATESSLRLFGANVSFRGLLALIAISSLCVITFQHPDLFGKAFESATLLIVGFYFGQARKMQ